MSEAGTRLASLPTMPSRGRIMIVGGDAPSRTALSDLLVDDGFVVAITEDGGHAARAVEAFAPDVLIVDAGMPGTRPAQLAQALRSLPVVLLTAHENWSRGGADLDDGQCIPITKPVNVGALVVLVDGLLALARARVRPP